MFRKVKSIIFRKKPLTIFAKKTIVTVRLRSKYASVIINLILTWATQLYGKITKINEMSTVTHHFFLKLVQKRIKKAFIFRGSSLTAHKDKFMSIESPKQAFWLAPNALMHRKEFRGILSPVSSSQEQLFF